MIFDSHSHYDDEAFDEDRDELLSSLKDKGVDKIISVASSWDSLEKVCDISHRYSFAYPALGIHPENATDLTPERVPLLEALIEKERPVAIGEIGLDYHYDEPPRDFQKEIFIYHLELAKIYAKKLMKLSVTIGIISGVILFFLTGPIVSIAGRNLTETSQTYLRWMLYFCCFYVVSKAANTVFIHGCFYAGGDMKFGLICDAINLWGFILPVGYILAFVIGAPVLVVYCFLNMDEIVKIPAEYIHYRKFGWVRNITLKNISPPEEEAEGAGG